jgi:hypothetical protein
MTTKITPVGALAIAGILKNQGLATPANLALANTTFSTTQLSGASQTRLATANAAVVTALTANVPAFLTGIVPVSWRAAIPGAVKFNVNNVVDTVRTTAADILGNNCAKFTEIISLASEFAKTSYDLSGSILGIKRQEDIGLNYSSINGQVTGGVAEQFNSNLIGTTAWQVFTSNLSNLGTLFDASDLPDCFLPRNLLENLGVQGQLQSITAAFTAANITDTSGLTDKQITTVLDQTLTTEDIHQILDACEAELLSNVTNTRFSDLLNLHNYIDTAGHVVVDTGANLALKLYNIAGVNSQNSTFEQWGETLSQISVQGNLSLITAAYNNPATFANAVSISVGNFGSGSTVFGTPTLIDIIGPTADLISADTKYSTIITEINSLQANILANALGQTLLTAITSGSNADIITAGTAVATASGNVGLAVTLGNQLFKRVFDHVALVKSNLIACEITDANGNILSDISGTATSVRGFITNNYEYYTADQNIGLGFGAVMTAMTTNELYGQSILASQAESRNLEILRGASITTESDAAIDAVEYGKTLGQVSANVSTAANLTTEANLSFTITNTANVAYGEVFDLPIVIGARYEPTTDIYLPDNRLLFTHLATPDFITVEFDIADTETRNFWFRVSGDLTVNNFAANVVQTTGYYTSKTFRLALRTTTNLPPTINSIISFRIELYLTPNADSRPIWNSADIRIIPYGLSGSVETGE